MEAANHTVHARIFYLVTKGAIQKKTKQFLPAFQALESTSAVKLFKLEQFPTDLLVTADFMHTVKKPAGTRKATFITDSFQRAVQWVVSVPDPKNPTQSGIWSSSAPMKPISYCHRSSAWIRSLYTCSRQGSTPAMLLLTLWTCIPSATTSRLVVFLGVSPRSSVSSLVVSTSTHTRSTLSCATSLAFYTCISRRVSRSLLMDSSPHHQELGSSRNRQCLSFERCFCGSGTRAKGWRRRILERY
jgi:hypothetical protein